MSTAGNEENFFYNSLSVRDRVVKKSRQLWRLFCAPRAASCKGQGDSKKIALQCHHHKKKRATDYDNSSVPLTQHPVKGKGLEEDPPSVSPS
jgi:hypothetical protein